MFELKLVMDSSPIERAVACLDESTEPVEKPISMERIESQLQASETAIRSTSVAERNMFEDICGMDKVKTDLTIALIYPMQFPNLFSGRRIRPYKGFLLFGPTGTGKTHIARTVAREAVGINFLYVSPADILSGHIGESKKKVRQLFEMARRQKPSIIFIDEFDWLASKEIEDGEIRDAQAELLFQLKSVLGITDGIFFMAATRCPQELDPQLLRWFDKLIYVSLPDKPQRLQILKKELSAIKSVKFSEDNYRALAEKTDRFSQADINRTCKSATFSSMCRLLENYPVHNSGNAAGATCECCTPILTYNDVLHAVQEAHTFVDFEEVKKLEKFAEENGVVVIERHVEPRVPRTLFESLSYYCCDFFANLFI